MTLPSWNDQRSTGGTIAKISFGNWTLLLCKTWATFWYKMTVSSRGCNPRISISSCYHLCPEIHVIRFMVNFDKSLRVNHLVLTLGLAFLFRLAFRLGLGWLYVSLRRRTLYDLYFTYFLPEVIMKFTRKARGHFVRLTECIFLRHNILYASQYHFVYMFYMFYRCL